MKKPVIAIGLDSAEPQLLEQWMAQGYLKNLQQLREQGTYGRLQNIVNYAQGSAPSTDTDQVWIMFATGCLPDKTGYWTPIHFHPQTYTSDHDPIKGGYDFRAIPPFYALGSNYRVLTFDLVAANLADRVNGAQILGWGGHAPHTPSHSQPPELLPELIQQYGPNPLLHRDYGCWWDPAYYQRMQTAIPASIATRTALWLNLLDREPWDLCVGVFGETHNASHDFWHLSQPDHPLYPTPAPPTDPLLEVFQVVDQGLGQIMAAHPDADVIVFSAHGMAANCTDMSTMLFLPEFLYRWNFPGRQGIAVNRRDAPPIRQPQRKSWAGEVWQHKQEANWLRRSLRRWLPSRFEAYLAAGQALDLSSPDQLRHQADPLAWMPARWYQPWWPHMQAFALPAFTEGQIRINLQGREAQGIVLPSAYAALCDQLTEFLYGLKDGRTGTPIVKQVLRTRHTATDANPNLPTADLMVLWQEQPTDVVESPELGRLGPITYYRTGGHRSEGFCLAKGSGITPGSTLTGGQVIDLGPTILHRLGAPIPAHCDGRPLLPHRELG